jgi:hypothetical protein
MNQIKNDRWRLFMGLTMTAAAGCGGSDPSVASAGADYDVAIKAALVATGAYADSAYNSYQTAAKGRISFQLSVVAQGAMADIAGAPINDLIGVPAFWIREESSGTDIITITREPRNPDEDEWSQPVMLTDFDQLGHPVAAGTYRRLSVATTLPDGAETHQSLELCWSAQGYCIVMDPVVLQLDAFAESRSELQAQGWKVLTLAKLTPIGVNNPDAVEPGVSAAAAKRCTVNSHPTWTGIQITWSPYTSRYKDIFGITLVSKSLGGQQAGVSCYTSGSACHSSGFGYSNPSSCYGTLGYNCDCDQTGVQSGTSGASTKTWAQTKCAHRFAGSASVSWTRNGSGSGVSISWNTNGGVDSNGGSILDTCSWH